MRRPCHCNACHQRNSPCPTDRRLYLHYALGPAPFRFPALPQNRQRRPLRQKAGQVFPLPRFWVFEMLWVWTVSLPLTIPNSPKVQDRQHSFGTGRDIVCIILFTIGFTMESVSYIQKYRFRSSVKDKAVVCDKGFFAWTRHLNYFGEILIQSCGYQLQHWFDKTCTNG